MSPFRGKEFLEALCAGFLIRLAQKNRQCVLKVLLPENKSFRNKLTCIRIAAQFKGGAEENESSVRIESLEMQEKFEVYDEIGNN